MRFLALGLCVALTAPLAAQSAPVELLVIDDATDAAIAGVSVSIAGQPGERVTDERGRFVYPSQRPGKVVFLFRRLGYNPGTLTVDATAGDTTRVTFAMTAAPQALTTVAVRDTTNSLSPFLSGFDRRMANHAGSATYITRDVIEMRKPSLTTDLLRRVSSISIIDSSGVLMAVSRRVKKPTIRSGGLGDLAPCPLQVALDGQLKEWGYAVNSIAPEEIHGIEVYPGPATIPAEYASMGRDAYCGLIMIWTRRSR
jgi:hypothetical protein